MATQPTTNTIRIINPSVENEPRTYLTADTVAGATTLATIDNSGFATSGDADYYVLIGEYGSQKSEIVLVDAGIAGTTDIALVVSATKYSHEASDPVTFIPFNQIKVYGGTTSGFTPSINSPLATIDIDPSEQFTSYTYSAGTYSYFVIAYYNVNDTTISSYSDEITVTSYTKRSIKRIIEAGLRKALTKLDRTQDSALNWEVAVEVVQDGIDEILTLKRTWSFLRTIKADTTTTANVAYIPKPTDISMLEFIIVNNLQLTLMTRLEYNNYVHGGAITTSGQPTHFIEKNDKYYLLPTPSTAYDIIYEYYKIPATITSDLSTELDLPFVPMLIHYCAAHFAWIRGNDKRGDKMYKLFQNLLEQQIIEYSGPEQTGQAESIERTSAYDTDIMPDSYRY